jgi:hypothetical protein
MATGHLDEPIEPTTLGNMRADGVRSLDVSAASKRRMRKRPSKRHGRISDWPGVAEQGSRAQAV